uniref:Uncharacterized protein n=1 Tax=Cyanothece sp. (strain PCC 7425 / ATCC 29141) TaxID=395961 RepID=B8HYZ9_CYAP4
MAKPRKIPKSFRVVQHHPPHPHHTIAAAESYLFSGEVSPLTACQTAYSCLFGPLGIALTGGSAAEVESAIAISRSQFEIFMALAQGRCQVNTVDDPQFGRSPAAPPENHLKPVPSLAKGNWIEEDEMLDLENERL